MDIKKIIREELEGDWSWAEERITADRNNFNITVNLCRHGDYIANDLKPKILELFPELNGLDPIPTNIVNWFNNDYISEEWDNVYLNMNSHNSGGYEAPNKIGLYTGWNPCRYGNVFDGSRLLTVEEFFFLEWE
jgi:hypothetical protein